jgi:hypothetical protein
MKCMAALIKRGLCEEAREDFINALIDAKKLDRWQNNSSGLEERAALGGCGRTTWWLAATGRPQRLWCAERGRSYAG